MGRGRVTNTEMKKEEEQGKYDTNVKTTEKKKVTRIRLELRLKSMCIIF